MSTSSTWLSTARTPAFCHFRIVFHLSPQRFRKLSTETALQSLCPHPAFCLGKPAQPVQNPARMCGGTFFLKGNDLLCSTGERFLFFYRGTISFLLKRKEGERFLFLKKRNKRHCGAVDLSVNRCFPACPARNKKTDGSYVNRPFCAARWRKRQEHRRKAAPQLIFFCVVGLHGKADTQARRTRAETRRRREAYPLWYSDRRQRRICLRPSV